MAKARFALGFDLSLTAPAAVALPLDWRPGDWKRAKSWLLKPKAPKNEDTAGQLVRYAEIADWAWSVAGQVGAPAAYAIEQYAFSKNNAYASRLMELGGVVRLRLFQGRDMVATVVSTSEARKLLIGKVPRSEPKVAVQLALFAAGAPKTWDDNVCDALVVCNHLLSDLGSPALMLHKGVQS